MVTQSSQKYGSDFNITCDYLSKEFTGGPHYFQKLTLVFVRLGKQKVDIGNILSKNTNYQIRGRSENNVAEVTLLCQKC